MMSLKGVTEKEMKILARIFSFFSDKYKFYFYGSRVKGDFWNISDLDVLLWGDERATYNDVDTLKILCDHSDLPYSVSFADYHSLDPRFYKRIEKDLVKFVP